jgi:Tfp pilus assembly protein PilE
VCNTKRVKIILRKNQKEMLGFQNISRNRNSCESLVSRPDTAKRVYIKKKFQISQTKENNGKKKSKDCRTTLKNKMCNGNTGKERSKQKKCAKS